MVQDVMNRLSYLRSKGSYLKQIVQQKLIEHKFYINKYRQDIPEIQNRKWGEM